MPREDGVVEVCSQPQHLLLFLEFDYIGGELLVQAHVVLQRRAQAILNVECIIDGDVEPFTDHLYSLVILSAAVQ